MSAPGISPNARPGRGWLDEFYVTHYLHYLAAAMLLGIVFGRVARVPDHTSQSVSQHGFRVDWVEKSGSQL
jgi:hypothetical protein